MAELSPDEKAAISHRGKGRTSVAAMARSALTDTPDPDTVVPSKAAGAAVSVVSNTSLILLKVVAGIVTGSVALLTEALHSSIDLVASIVAFFSVRMADEPADDDHPYGHEKIENVAAGIEGC